MTRSASSSELDLQLRAKAELERRRRGETDSTFTPYRFDPKRYITEKLGWMPWSGDAEHPGQLQVIDAYTLALRQQEERNAYEQGAIEEHDLEWWTPGTTIKNWLRVEAGHTVGKTKLSSGLVNHFFDCFEPAIVYTFAPSKEQIKDLLWKEIKADRGGKGLPGEILDLGLRRGPNHFAKGRATNDNNGNGTERVQGQHGPYLMFVIDEAEGVPDFVFSAIRSMASGGVVIVLMLANPRTRISRFHKLKSQANVANFRISCLYHPNVIADRELVPGAVRREYITEVMREHYEEATVHDSDAYTFELPWQPGVIYRPNPEFMFRVLGIAPANVADNTLVPQGRYEAATKRDPSGDDPTKARMGVDAARWGKDYGTLYVEHGGRVWRAAQLWKLDTIEYYERIRQEALALPATVTSLHIRVDGGGGFGSGVIDLLRRDLELRRRFSDFKVYEVHFNGTPRDEKAYNDLATEMYVLAGERLKALRLERPPEVLEIDICERTYEWVIHKGQTVKKLLPKDKFKKEHGHSPDDGDGWALCTAPDWIFRNDAPPARAGGQRTNVASYRPR